MQEYLLSIEHPGVTVSQTNDWFCHLTLSVVDIGSCLHDQVSDEVWGIWQICTWWLLKISSQLGVLKHVTLTNKHTACVHSDHATIGNTLIELLPCRFRESYMVQCSNLEVIWVGKNHSWKFGFGKFRGFKWDLRRCSPSWEWHLVCSIISTLLKVWIWQNSEGLQRGVKDIQPLLKVTFALFHKPS